MPTSTTHSGELPGIGVAISWPSVGAVEDKLFELFDTDGSHAIAFSEVLAVLDPTGQQTVLSTPLQRLLDEIDSNADQSLSQTEMHATLAGFDTNGDGVLSPADLGRELAHAGTAPMLAFILNGFPLSGDGPVEPGPPGPPTVTEVVDGLFARFDANDDKSLTLTELTGVLDPQNKHQKLDDALAALVAMVDKNADSRLSYAEVSAAVATLDTDGNGTIDHRDHVPGPPDDGSVDLIGQLMPHIHDFDTGPGGH